jgi:hypothetical protein
MSTLYKRVKTRKPHNCWGCCKEIPVGSIVSRTTTFDNGTAMTAYWCPVCDAVMVIVGDDWGDQGYAYGDIIDNEKELYEEIAAKMEAQKEAPASPSK